MKKLLVLAVSLLGLTTMTAQEFNFGIKGGLNSSTIGGDVKDTKALVAFNAGVFAEIKLGDILGIQPELVYSAQGTKFKTGDDLKLNYLQVPVMVKLYLFDIIYAEAGPQVGFLMSAKSGSTDIKDQINSTEVALGVGAGVNIADKIRLGLRFNFGLTDVFKDSPTNNADYTSRNVVFQVGAAYIF